MFSVRWDSVQNLATSGNYNLIATADDGVRVWVDGVLVIDQWHDQPPTTYSVTRWLWAGARSFRIEYYEHGGGAQISFQISTGGVPPPPPPGEITVDDRGPGWQMGGLASSWRSTGSGIGGHAYWTFNNAVSAANYNWGRWYPTLSGPRNYEVFAYIPAWVATTTNARYCVAHAGRFDMAARAQAFFPNQWVSLGTYYFTAAGNEYVSLSDVTYECYLCRTVVFDAVKFSPR
jgi:hypothetical protein